MYYEYIKNTFDAKLLFTDRDSLIYEIKTEDVYKDFYGNKNLFDFIDYLLNAKFFDQTNKKVIGKMKDEFRGKIISEFVGLRSKMSSLISAEIRHKEFVDFLFNRKVIRHNMKKIQSRLHRIGTYDVCKISLSCFNDERYVLDNGVNSLAYFHKDIKY